MFTQSAFTDNIPEMRDWLEKIGYEDQMIRGNSILYACKGKIYTTEPHYPSFRLMQKEGVLDCRNNPDLFKAIAALRDDSDYMQWFRYESTMALYEWVLCKEKYFKGRKCHIDTVFGEKKYSYECQECYHKATVKELIEYFRSIENN